MVGCCWYAPRASWLLQVTLSRPGLRASAQSTLRGIYGRQSEAPDDAQVHPATRAPRNDSPMFWGATTNFGEKKSLAIVDDN